VKPDAVTIIIEWEGHTCYAYSDDYPGARGMGSTIQEAQASLLWAVRIQRRKNSAKSDAGSEGTDGIKDGTPE
jgi:hypothetical protein